MARDPFYDLVSKMGKGRRDKVANAAGKPVIPPSALGNVAMTDPMQMMSVNGRPDLMKPALPNGITMSNPTPNPAMGPGGRPGVAKSDMVTGGGFGTGPNGNPTYTGDWGDTVFGYDPSAGMPPKNQDRVPEDLGGAYTFNPAGQPPTQVGQTTQPRPGANFPSLPPVEPLGPIGYSPTAPARDPFASLFGGSIPTPQSKPNRFDDAMNSFAPTLQPTVGQIMQGPAGVFGRPARFGPNPPPPPAPKPSPWPTPQANPMRGIGGPDLMMAGPQGGVSPDRMGEFGEFGTDPFGYGGLTGQMGDGTSAGVMGGGFANAGYGSPSYGVNPVTAGHDLAAAQQEGFSYGSYNPSDPGGAGATKVVCTAMNEAYGFGGFRNTIWLAYAAAHLKPEHERGYHAIFVPLLAYARGGVSLPRQAMWLSLAHIARHRTADIRAEMRGGKRDRLGRMYRAVLEPLCYVVGKVLG